jgi:hypothetical protein
VGYAPASDTLYVASAGDGSVRLFRGADLVPAGQISLGSDADNVRVDGAGRRVYVGYGAGALAVIEDGAASKIADMPLKAHPESFQLDLEKSRAYVNVPDAGGEIAVVDTVARKQIGAWQARGARANFPMALDPQAGRLFVAFRHPARLVVFGTGDGKVEASLDLCGDADDVFFDARRGRVYASCGQGTVDVFGQQGGAYVRIDRRPTVSGARTALFVAEIDRLFVAARADSGEPAAIWVFRPVP